MNPPNSLTNTASTGELSLRDIHLPDAVSWWPPASGWWLLVLLVVLIVAAFLLYKKLKPGITRHKNYKRIALTQLKQIQQQHPQASIQLLRELSALLRRIAISYYPREDMASLTGAAWFKQLNQLSPGAAFNEQQQTLLSNAAYQPQAEFDAQALIQQCENWIKHLPDAKTSSEVSS